MNFERIITYGVEDFIIDEDFRRIPRSPNDNIALANLALKFPEKEFEIKLADEILKALRVSRFTQSTQRKDELWNELRKEFL